MSKNFIRTQVRTLYLIIAILAIITAVPIIGWWVDSFRVFTLILAGLSLYLVIRLVKFEPLNIGAILMLVSCCVTLLGSILLLVASVVSFQEFVFEPYNFNLWFGNLFLTSFTYMYAGIFLVFGWIVKIVAIVFCFKHYTQLV